MAFLRDVTFGRIQQRLEQKSLKEDPLGKYVKSLCNKEAIPFRGEDLPNAFQLFLPGKQEAYLKKLNITPGEWHDICILLETIEVRPSPSDITPSNLKLNPHNKEKKPTHFGFDQGRMDDHSYAYTHCKLMGPFAEYFWFRISQDTFVFEQQSEGDLRFSRADLSDCEQTHFGHDPQKLGRSTPCTIRHPASRPPSTDARESFDIQFTEDSSTQSAISTYTQQIAEALSQSPAHRELLANRPLFTTQMIFYSIRQLVADTPYRKKETSMRANCVMAAILMKDLLLKLKDCLIDLKKIMGDSQESSLEDFIRNPDHTEKVRQLTDARYLEEVGPHKKTPTQPVSYQPDTVLRTPKITE